MMNVSGTLYEFLFLSPQELSSWNLPSIYRMWNLVAPADPNVFDFSLSVSSTGENYKIILISCTNDGTTL